MKKRGGLFISCRVGRRRSEVEVEAVEFGKVVAGGNAALKRRNLGNFPEVTSSALTLHALTLLRG